MMKIARPKQDGKKDEKKKAEKQPEKGKKCVIF